MAGKSVSGRLSSQWPVSQSVAGCQLSVEVAALLVVAVSVSAEQVASGSRRQVAARRQEQVAARRQDRWQVAARRHPCPYVGFTFTLFFHLHPLDFFHLHPLLSPSPSSFPSPSSAFS